MAGTSRRSPLRHSLLGACVLALAALLAACGGGESTQTMSKAALIKAGDAICHQAEKAKGKDFFAFVKEHPTAVQSKAGEKEVLLDVALPILEEELSDLQGLEPETGTSEYQAILAALEGGVSGMRAQPLSVLKEATSPVAKANRLAKAYGFKNCSSFL
jgi:gas vesicle protein